MPPGRRTGPMFGASVAGIMNSTAQSDDEARRRVVWTFGSVLTLLFLLDVAGSFATLYLVCRYDDDEEDHHHRPMAQCLARSIRQGIQFHPISKFAPQNDDNDNDNADDSFGDLFILSLIRCVLTVLLLQIGVRYGRHSKHTTPTAAAAAAAAADITTPSNSNTNIEGNGNELEEPLLPSDEDRDPSSSSSSSTAEVGHSTRCGCCTTSNSHTQRRSWMTPARAKNLVFAILFLTSTLYQVYAGLKVSTTNATSRHNHDHHFNTLLIVLLCLTVLWINAQAVVFRTLLEELTREEGLFLPPEVHRHPMYYQDNRGLAMHWCDLCSKRISGGCYRCSLCDFDVCAACAKRNDAATVGENMLRGDQGVRVEANLSTVGYFQRSLQVAKTELPLLLVSFFLLALSSISRLLLPHYQGHIIDKVIPQEDGEYDKAGFLRYIQVYIWIMLVQGAISTIYSAIFTLVSRRLKFTIRNALLEKILVQDMAYFDGTESGRLISRLTNDLDLMMSPIQSSLSSLLSNILILFGGMVMCFYKSYRLSMLAFVTVGPISYLWEQYALWSKGLAREMLSHWAEGNSIASQALSHVRTVKAFGCEHKVLEKYSETNEQALHCGIKDAWGNGITSALTGYLDLGSGVLILYFGGLLVYNGELSVGELVTFQLFWNLMNNAYQNLQGLITDFTRSAAGAEKVFSLWDSDPDIDPKKGRDITWDVQGNLQLKDVTFYYQMRPDNVVLKKFSLDIPGGKTIALVGRSGGGKSTIINLLLRFYDPREGKLVLDGNDYDSLQVHQLRRLFGVVTQETELFALTVEENIAYGLGKDEYTMEDVINASKKAFAHEFISEMKDGYQTRIGERGNRLSGGQRQRLAIARVFLRRPKIILLDEATSALDENSQEAVHKALSNLIAESNATVVLVAHRLSTVVNADCICVIDQGSVLEQGDHDELVAKGGIYASMVEKQIKKKSDLLEQEEQGTGDDQMTAKKQASLDDIDSLLADKK
jgi:ABC-type multidrug transport system fused ATPase/permease subunit